MRFHFKICKKKNCFCRYSEFGEVNISALLNSFQMGYDKRVRPNYGGEIILMKTKAQDKQTERQKDRKGQTDKQTERQADRKASRHKD